MEKAALQEGKQISEAKQLAMLNRVEVMLQSQSSNGSALGFLFDIELPCSGS